MKHLIKILAIFLIVKTGAAQSYVQLTNCNDFTVGGTVYKPLLINYIVEFVQDANNQWYISPERNSSAMPGPNGTMYVSDSAAQQKIIDDLTKIKKLNFTEIRLIGIGMKNTGTTLLPTYEFPTGNNQTTYFNLLDNFLNQASAPDPTTGKGLRVMLLLGPGREYFQNEGTTFKYYLSTVSNYYKNNDKIMAYDLFNEPENSIWPAFGTGADDKYRFAKMINDWNNCIKKNDSHHLTTIGLRQPVEDLFMYDPMLLSVDFISYHPYNRKPADFLDSNKIKDIMNTYLYWTGKTIKMPWIIGETSYSATDEYETYTWSHDNDNPPTYPHHSLGGLTYPYNGPVTPEDNQKAFATHMLQRSTDCNCKGFSWWAFQEGWRSGDPLEDYMGLYRRYSSVNVGAWGVEGLPKKIADPVTSPFLDYNILVKTPASCVATNSLTILAGPTGGNVFTGTVTDQNSAVLPNAVVKVRIPGEAEVITFTNGSGYFSLNLPAGKGYQHIDEIFISYPEYSNYFQGWGTAVNDPNYNPAIQNSTYILTKITTNSWVKEWGNDHTTDKLSAVTSPPASTDWVLSAYDKFYKGDFDGNGKEDLLCVKYSNSTTTSDRMAMYTFTEKINQYPISGTSPTAYYYNLNDSWKLLWDKPTSPDPTQGIYPYRNNLVVGDFDGNNTDDIISINGSGKWTTWFSFAPNSNPVNAEWTFRDSNYGHNNDGYNPMSYMAPYLNNVIAGKFYDTAKDAIIGVTPSGWITSFKLVGSTWTWAQSNEGNPPTTNVNYALSYLTSYTNQLVPGDFDGDGYDEVLGNNAGNLAIFKPVWNASNSYYKWVNASNAPYWYDTGVSGMQLYTGNLIVGNIDGDNNDEILGFGTSGYSANFNFSENTGGQTFTCAMDGGNLNRISDWNLLPNNAKYLLIKTDQNAINNRQKLLAIRINSRSSFFANMYAFRPNEKITWPCSTARKANPSESERIPASRDNVSIHPNPSDGLFTIVFEHGEMDKSITLTVFDIQGKILESYTSEVNMEERSIRLNLKGTKTGVYFVRITTNNKIYTKKVIIL